MRATAGPQPEGKRRSTGQKIGIGRDQSPPLSLLCVFPFAAFSSFCSTLCLKGGSGLPGGQRQRLAIARAVLLDPAILLLDDPTASIDAETEHEIVEAMQSAMAGRTTFIVAHRLSTLRNADLVIVLDHGSIVQMGTHEDLLRREGYYAVAARLQKWDRAA